MYGECDRCGEHCVDCQCGKQSLRCDPKGTILTSFTSKMPEFIPIPEQKCSEHCLDCRCRPNCARQQNGWIRNEDRLPPQDVYVLIVTYDSREKVKMSFVQIASRIGNRWFDDKNVEELKIKYGTVTHWMPIPEPPKEV